MKKLQILFAVLVSSAILFHSCGDGEDKVNPKPIVTLQNGGNYTSADVSKGMLDSVHMLMVVSSEDKLSNITITKSVDGAAATTVLDSSVKGTSFSHALDFKLNGSEGTEKFTFTATTKEGETASKSVTITKSVPSKEVKDQKVYHILGPNLGAFDLVTGIPKASGDPTSEKDIIDESTTTTFSKSWGNSNGTKYILNAPDVDYTSLSSVTAIKSAYEDNVSQAADIITNLKAGDVILVKSGQTTDDPYFVIQLTDVVETTGDNLDYYKFNFKGK